MFQTGISSLGIEHKERKKERKKEKTKGPVNPYQIQKLVQCTEEMFK